jgi:uncharacterized Zn finger protein (UPF0148 family)
MFKEKTSKKRNHVVDNSKKNTTLDARHQEMIKEIEKGVIEKEKLKEKKQDILNKISIWKEKIRNIHNNKQDNTPEYQEAWTSNIYFNNKLRLINIELDKLLDENKEIEYYENTGNILFDYYNLIENQESMVTNINAIDIEDDIKYMKGNKKKSLPPNQKNILEAFNLTNIKEDISNIEDCSDVDEEDFENKKDNIKDKTSLVDEYLFAIEPNHIKSNNNNSLDTCQLCDTQLLLLLQEGLMICNTCGYQELLLVEQNRPVYRQANKESSHQSYKRINHFNEWVSQIQGKESTDIPTEIFERIVQEIKKEKIRDTGKLSYNKMREILKKLKYNKYYEHIYYIIYRLNGISPPNFSPELEERLRNMFKEIQGPFLKHCPEKRKNFLSYSYVLFKFCQLLEKDEYLKHFSLLKSREKLHVQDQIWRKICEEVNWEYIQSI